MIVLMIALTLGCSLLGLGGLAGMLFGAMLFDSHSRVSDFAGRLAFASFILMAVSAGIGIWLAWANWNGGENLAAMAWFCIPLAPLAGVVVAVRWDKKR